MNFGDKVVMDGVLDEFQNYQDQVTRSPELKAPEELMG